MFNPDNLAKLYKALCRVSLVGQAGARHSAQTACEHMMQFIHKTLSQPTDIKRLYDRIDHLWQAGNMLEISRVILVETSAILHSNEIHTVDQSILDDLIDHFQRISGEQRDLLASPTHLFIKILDLEKEATDLLEEKNYQEAFEVIIQKIVLSEMLFSKHHSVYGERLLSILRKEITRLPELVGFFIQASNLLSAVLAHQVLHGNVIALLRMRLTQEDWNMIKKTFITLLMYLISQASALLQAARFHEAAFCRSFFISGFKEYFKLFNEEDRQRYHQEIVKFDKLFMVKLIDYFLIASRLIMEGKIVESINYRDLGLLMLFQLADQWQIELDHKRIDDALNQYRRACIAMLSLNTIDYKEFVVFFGSFQRMTGQQQILLGFPSDVFTKIVDLKKKAAVLSEEKSYHEAFALVARVGALTSILPLEYIKSNQKEIVLFLNQSLYQARELLDFFIQKSECVSARLAFMYIVNFIDVKNNIAGWIAQDSEFMKSCYESVTRDFVFKANDLLKAGKLAEASNFYRSAIYYFAFIRQIIPQLDWQGFERALFLFKETFIPQFVETLEEIYSLIKADKTMEIKSSVSLPRFLSMQAYALEWGMQLNDLRILTVIKKIVDELIIFFQNTQENNPLALTRITEIANIWNGLLQSISVSEIGNVDMQDMQDEKAEFSTQSESPSQRSSSSICPSAALFTRAMDLAPEPKRNETKQVSGFRL